MLRLRGHTINGGRAEGEAVVTSIPFSFAGELDAATGAVPSPGQDIFGENIAGKILVCPTGRGSSGGPSVLWLAKANGVAPAAILCVEAEPVIAIASITADIPMMDRLERNPLEVIKSRDYVVVDATQGTIEIEGRHGEAGHP